jgi:nitrite reductase/ring-hydroxylating ferredoxin subunit
MAPANIEVFAICPADSIAPGAAKPFRLSRIDESGASRPFSIVVIRTLADEYFAYLNVCPHGGVWLNIGAGAFFSADGQFLKCGRHGANFAIDTGLCVAGPCEGQSLQPLALAIVDRDVCLCGIALVEDDELPNPFDELDDTMEIMIHPD